MKKHILSIILLAVLVIVMTYPLATKLSGYIPGFFSTDEPFGNIWGIWQVHYSLLHKLSLDHTDLMCYPFGFDVFGSGYVSYLWVGITRLASLFLQPILFYNLQLIINLFLSALFTYLLVFYLNGGNKLSAIFSGIIFAFCPYQFVRIWQHLGLTFNEWIPLCVFSAILLKDKGSIKDMLLFSLSLVLLFSFDWSVMYLAMITLGWFFIFILFYRWKIKFSNDRRYFYQDAAYIKKVILVFIFTFSILSFQFAPLIMNSLKLSGTTVPSVQNVFHRPFEDLFVQSARPLSYFLPAVVHPLFGKLTQQFIGSQLYGMSLTEHTLYLGWVPIILAIIAIRQWRKRRKEKLSQQNELFRREDFYIGFFILLAIIAWFFSQPPWWNIFGFKLYMPSFFMYKILPMFRAYCRFGIVLMLAVAVLSGFGLKFILARFNSRMAKLAVTVSVCGLVLFEFWNYPPFKVIDVFRVPEVYYWIKAQPGDFVIAEYLLDADSPNEMYKFYQTKHEKKIINGTIQGTYANKITRGLTELSIPQTSGKLKSMGVKYVLVHRDGYINTELIKDREELGKIPKNPGLKFVQTFLSQKCPVSNIMCVQETGPVDIYEVIASPVKLEVEQK